jgi:hypothetical protein
MCKAHVVLYSLGVVLCGVAAVPCRAVQSAVDAGAISARATPASVLHCAVLTSVV